MIPFSISCKASDLLAAVARAQMQIESTEHAALLDAVLRALGPGLALVVSDGRAEVIPNPGAAE